MELCPCSLIRLQPHLPSEHLDTWGKQHLSGNPSYPREGWGALLPSERAAGAGRGSFSKGSSFSACLAGCTALSMELRFSKACILLLGCPKTVKISHSQACIDLQSAARAGRICRRNADRCSPVLWAKLLHINCVLIRGRNCKEASLGKLEGGQEPRG